MKFTGLEFSIFDFVAFYTISCQIAKNINEFPFDKKVGICNKIPKTSKIGCISIEIKCSM